MTVRTKKSSGLSSHTTLNHHNRLWFSDDENDILHDDSSDYGDDDSDSNAEDYYRNDYPEDELSEDEYPCRLSSYV